MNPEKKLSPNVQTDANPYIFIICYRNRISAQLNNLSASK